MSIVGTKFIHYKGLYSIIGKRGFAAISSSPSFPVIQSCPSPTCSCENTPAGLDIDYSKSLNGTLATYSQQLIIFSGQQDWTSRIEEESKNETLWGTFTANVKNLLLRGGEFFDPYDHTLINVSSFESSSKAIDTLIFPGFKHVSIQLGPNNTSKLPLAKQFANSYLLPRSRRVPSSQNQSNQPLNIRNSSSDSELFVKESTIKSPLILICSHGSRDQRCGVLGPLLHSEFTRYLTQNKHFIPAVGSFEPEPLSDIIKQNKIHVNVGTISHVGGHKWAGNVILYIPPNYSTSNLAPDGQNIPFHPLSGASIWYGRVEPRHVEGIIEQTLINGNIILDLFRGGIDKDGKTLKV